MVSSANEFACQTSPIYPQDPTWSTSGEKNLKFLVSWSFRDPENCILGMDHNIVFDGNFTYGTKADRSDRIKFPTSWKVSREGEMALISAETELSIPLLLSLSNKNFDGYGTGLSLNNRDFEILAFVKLRKGNGFSGSSVSGTYGIAQVWGHWFSKSQGLHPKDCEPQLLEKSDTSVPKSNLSYEYKILEYGLKPKVEIIINDPNNCIFLVHSAALTPDKRLGRSNFWNYAQTLAEYPYWHPESAAYFDSILKSPTDILEVGLNVDLGSTPIPSINTESYLQSNATPVLRVPSKLLSHTDSVARIGNQVKITSSIDTLGLSLSPTDNVVFYLGTYKWFTRNISYISGGWNITYSGNSWTARYSKGYSNPGGLTPSYYTKGVSILASELLVSPEAKAAADAKTAADKAAADAKTAADKAAADKAAADAKTAAEQKRKQEEDLRLAPLKQSCLQHNVDVEQLFTELVQLKSSYPSEFKSYFEKTLILKSGYEIRDIQNVVFRSRLIMDCDKTSDYDDWRMEYRPSELEQDKKNLARHQQAIESSSKKTTITCVKGKLTKKVTAVKPKCPSGYKVKK